MAAESKKALEVFFSYSHKDEALRDELETHLSLLRKQGYISTWHDRKIVGGEEWAEEIDAHLNTADIILLLVSASFLASNYCYGIEMKQAMERHNAGEARVIPIILRFCDWHNAPFGKLQSLPIDGKPVDSPHWHSKDQAFYNITWGVRKAIESSQMLNVLEKAQGVISVVPSRINEKLAFPKIKVNKPFNPYKIRGEWIDYITSNLRELIEREDSFDFYADDIQGKRQIRILFNQKTVYSLDIHKGTFGGSRSDDGISFSYTEGRATLSSGFNAWGNFKWDNQKDTVVLSLMDMGMLSHLGDNKEYTQEEFLSALWHKIKLAVERSDRY